MPDRTQEIKNLRAVAVASKNYIDKRIDDLEWQMGTYNYDVDTDSNVARNKTLPSDTYKSQIDYIGGKSVKYNQLVQNGNFESNSGWNLYGGTLSVSNNIGTFTITDSGQANRIEQTNLNITQNHKILMIYVVKPNKNTTFYIQSFGSTNQDVETFIATANTNNNRSIIFTSSYNNTGIRLYCNRYSDLQNGDSVQYSNIMLIDLTDIFGAGNEPSDVASAIPLLKANGYKLDGTDTYSTGSLKHAITTSVVYSGTDVQDITLPIPSEVLALELYKSAGSVYDVIDFNNKAGTRKVGTYTFTGNEQIDNEGNLLFAIYLPAIQPKVASYGGVTMAGLTDRYSYAEIAGNDYSVGINFRTNVGSIVFVRLTSSSTVNDAKTFITGKTVQYELADYVPYDLSQYFDTNWNKATLDNQYATCKMVVAEPIDMPNSITNLIKEVKA